MFEYGANFVRKCLDVWGYDLNDEIIELIKYVPVHQYAIATSEKPLLFVDNLQCCVALYAWTPNFGFLSHINTKDPQDYYVTDNQTPIKCRSMDDLYKSITNSGLTFMEPIKIGISIGCMPVVRTHPSMKSIYDGIQDLIKKLA